MKQWTYRGQIILVKNRQNLPNSNPEPDLYNINVLTKFGENPLIFIQVIIHKSKIRHFVGRWLSKNWQNLFISNLKPDLHNIKAHTKLGENPLKFTQAIVPKQIPKQKYGQTDIWQIDGWQKDRQTDGHTDDQCVTIIPHHYRVAGYNKSSAKRGIIRPW